MRNEGTAICRLGLLIFQIKLKTDMKTIKFSDGTELCSLGQGTWNMGRNTLKRKQETEALRTGIDLGMKMISVLLMRLSHLPQNESLSQDGNTTI